MHRQIIYDRLKERGVHVGGQKPVNTIGSYLSVDPRFSNVGRGMWDLTRGPKEDVSPDLVVLASDIREYEDDLPF